MLACFIGNPAVAFIAYDCSNSTNLVEAYSLLEPDACANMGKDGEVETSVYGEVAQVKQDRMIPVFRCMVVETLVAQYCGMFSAAGVKRRAETTGSLGVPAGKTERLGTHQREDRGWQNRGHHLPHHVSDRRAGRREPVRGGGRHPPRLTGTERAGGARTIRDHSPGGIRPIERVDRQLDTDLRCAGSGGRQEPGGQP